MYVKFKVCVSTGRYRRAAIHTALKFAGSHRAGHHQGFRVSAIQTAHMITGTDPAGEHVNYGLASM